MRTFAFPPYAARGEAVIFLPSLCISFLMLEVSRISRRDTMPVLQRRVRTTMRNCSPFARAAGNSSQSSRTKSQRQPYAI